VAHAWLQTAGPAPLATYHANVDAALSAPAGAAAAAQTNGPKKKAKAVPTLKAVPALKALNARQQAALEVQEQKRAMYESAG
jgi:hypothetical protein